MSQNVRQTFTDFRHYKVVTKDWRVAYSREELPQLGYKANNRRYSARTGQGCYSKFWWTLKDAIKMPSKKGAERRKQNRRRMASDRMHAQRIRFNYFHEMSIEEMQAHLLSGGFIMWSENENGHGRQSLIYKQGLHQFSGCVSGLRFAALKGSEFIVMEGSGTRNGRSYETWVYWEKTYQG